MSRSSLRRTEPQQAQEPPAQVPDILEGQPKQRNKDRVRRRSGLTFGGLIKWGVIVGVAGAGIYLYTHKAAWDKTVDAAKEGWTGAKTMVASSGPKVKNEYGITYAQTPAVTGLPYLSSNYNSPAEAKRMADDLGSGVFKSDIFFFALDTKGTRIDGGTIVALHGPKPAIGKVRPGAAIGGGGVTLTVDWGADKNTRSPTVVIERNRTGQIGVKTTSNQAGMTAREYSYVTRVGDQPEAGQPAAATGATNKVGAVKAPVGVAPGVSPPGGTNAPLAGLTNAPPQGTTSAPPKPVNIFTSGDTFSQLGMYNEAIREYDSVGRTADLAPADKASALVKSAQTHLIIAKAEAEKLKMGTGTTAARAGAADTPAQKAAKVRAEGQRQQALAEMERSRDYHMSMAEDKFTDVAVNYQDSGLMASALIGRGEANLMRGDREAARKSFELAAKLGNDKATDTDRDAAQKALEKLNSHK